MRVRWLVAVAAVAALLFSVPTAVSADGEIVVTVAGSSTGNAEGSRLLIADDAVAPEIVGNQCTGVVTTRNNHSVHTGNDIVITTNGIEYRIPGVEDGAGDVTTADGEIITGDNLRVELEFGPDGATSGGITLTLTCVDVQLPPTPPEPPTPTEPPFTG